MLERFLQQAHIANPVVECAVASSILFVAARFQSAAQVDIPNVARGVIERVRKSYPEESAEQHARRVIESAATLATAAGGLFHAPFLLPGVGNACKALGLVGGASALTRIHLYLILEVALIYDQDIDDPARVPEMAAVVAATATASTLPPLAIKALGWLPVAAIPAAALSAGTIARLIGDLAIRHYSGELSLADLTAKEETGDLTAAAEAI